MKLSKYITEAKSKKGDIVVHSGLTGTVLKVKKEDVKEFRLLCEGKKDLLTQDPILLNVYDKVIDIFKKTRIIIDDNIDEIRFLENAFFKARHAVHPTIAFTIAPTMKCNLACPYCYNPNSIKTSMSDETIKNVSIFIQKMLKSRAVHHRNFKIAWVGGEPLADMRVFEKLTSELAQMAQKNEANYSTTIVTNGTLITEDIALKLSKKPFNVNVAQISLDGHQEFHDQSRIYRDGRPTFDLICKGIKILSDYMQVNIRINVSGETKKEHIKKLINELLDREVVTKTRQPGFYLGRLHSVLGSSDGGCRIDPSKFNFLSMEEYARFEMDCARMAREMKFPLTIIDHHKPMFRPCAATGTDSYTIDSDGTLGKCWHSMGDIKEGVGSVKEGARGDFTSCVRKWLDYNPCMDEMCTDCHILPLCLGGCPHFRITEKFGSDKTEKCRPGKYDLAERLLFNYCGE